MQIRTRRLSLEPYRLDDVRDLYSLWTDSAVRQYLWDDEIISWDRAADTVASCLDDWTVRRYGQWVVRRLTTAELIGFCGFRPAAWCPDPELLFGFAPGVWGQGFATEAAIAALRYGFGKRGFDRVVAATDVPNAASVRVLERLGMRLERRGRLDDLDTLFYALLSHDFGAPPACDGARGA